MENVYPKTTKEEEKEKEDEDEDEDDVLGPEIFTSLSEKNQLLIEIYRQFASAQKDLGNVVEALKLLSESRKIKIDE